MTWTEPTDPIAAVVHRDPYPYYERLRAERPLYRDEALGLWVASSRDVVQEALAHPDLRVRPLGEPVPRALLGTLVGEVFALLVRMNDGDFHMRNRPALNSAAAQLPLARIAEAAAQCARDLAGRTDANTMMSALPVQTMARILGVPHHALDDTAAWVADFVLAIAPHATAPAIAKGHEAARQLMEQGRAEGLDEVRAANRVAMMQQSLDATAGLIGTTARALLEQPAMPAAGDPVSHWRAITADVARRDPPVHNTRRFAVADLQIGRHRIQQGEGVLLLLASAGLGFGGGPHACPGEAIAIEIAAAALRTLHGAGLLAHLFARPCGYRPLGNARVPVFATPDR